MNTRDILLYGLLIFAWSTSWLPLKYQLGVVAPEVSVLWRFIIASSIAFGLAKWRSAPLVFDRHIHLSFAAMGLFIFSTNFTLFYYASAYVASGLLAVVFSTASLMNILLVSVLKRTRPPLIQLSASLIGLSGVALIFWPELMISAEVLPALLLCIVGTLSFCAGNLVSASLQSQSISVMSSNCWGMFYGCIVLSCYALILDHPFNFEVSLVYIGGLLWLAIFASVIAFFCYLTLVGRIGAGKAGYATVVFPVFALLISTVFEAYQWSLLSVLGILLVLGGNVMMLRSR
ncbi:MAG: DMT family transporter [Candidatus Puniceispirillaceae bacterium]